MLKIDFNPFILRVRDFQNNTHQILCLGRGHTIEYIKFALSQKLGIDKDNIALVYNNRSLQDDRTLAEESVYLDSQITMVLKLRSGLI